MSFDNKKPASLDSLFANIPCPVPLFVDPYTQVKDERFKRLVAEQANAGLRERIAKVQAEAVDLQNRLNAQRGLTEQQWKEIASLKAVVKACNERYSVPAFGLTSEIEQARDEIKRLVAVYKQDTVVIIDLNNKIVKLKSENQALQKEVAALKALPLSSDANEKCHTADYVRALAFGKTLDEVRKIVNSALDSGVKP